MWRARPSRTLGAYGCDLSRWSRTWRSFLGYAPRGQSGPLGPLAILRTTLVASGGLGGRTDLDPERHDRRRHHSLRAGPGAAMSVLHHRRHGPARDPLLFGVAVLVVLAGAFYFALTRSVPLLGEGGRVVRAEFQTARQVTPKTPVRVQGVEVGKVESVRYDGERRLTEVEFRVTDDGVRLHRDASAALRWRTVLGGRMELALDPGSRSAPALRSDLIPLSRTRIQTELEDVTRALGGPAVPGMRTLLRELPQALEGPEAGRAIDALGPNLAPFATAARALRGERDGDLEALVASSARVVRGVDRAGGALSDLVRGAQQTLRTTADRRAQLAATFSGAPGALDATTRVARTIDATLPALDGLVADLRPGARRLGPVLAESRPTIVELRDVLAQARPLGAQPAPGGRPPRRRLGIGTAPAGRARPDGPPAAQRPRALPREHRRRRQAARVPAHRAHVLQPRGGVRPVRRHRPHHQLPGPAGRELADLRPLLDLRGRSDGEPEGAL